MAKIMTAEKFVQQANKIAKAKTVYMWGTYGRVVTTSLITTKKKQYPSQYTNKYVEMLKTKLGHFAFDCVGLIKGILWGWDGIKNVPYSANGVPDTNAAGVWNRCTDKSKDWGKVKPGAAVKRSGHIGIYIGDGLVIEASTMWEGGVQISSVTEMGGVSGYPKKSWPDGHGLLPWIDYSGTGAKPEPEPEPKPELKPEPKPEPGTFNDVYSDNWAYEAIERLAAQSIISGYEGTNEFKPDAALLRQQAAKIIALSAGLVASDLIDLDKNNAYPNEYIIALERAGVVNGYTTSKGQEFRPLGKTTRAQMAKMVVLAFNLKKGTVKVDFDDKVSSTQDQEYIDILASNGIVTGYQVNGKQYFKPYEDITRAQAAKIVDLAMQKK